MAGGSKDALRVLQGATLVLESLLREVSRLRGVRGFGPHDGAL